jgi:hypothetical protein
MTSRQTSRKWLPENFEEQTMTSRRTMIAGLAAALLAGAASVMPAAAQGGPGGPQGYFGMGRGMTGPGYNMGPGMMGQGYWIGPGMMGPTYGPSPWQGWPMGPGVTAPGAMGPGMPGPGYYGMAPGMTGQGYYGMGPGMMGPGYQMGPGYGMGPGMMYGGPGYQGPGYGEPGRQLDLSTDDVRSYFERQLAAGGNKRLRVGKVEALDDDAIEAQIETVDGSLVATYKVDRHTGAIAPAG